MRYWTKCLYVLLVLAFLTPAKAQQSSRTLLLEAIATTYDIHRTETLVYVRVYSDGFADAHPTHEVDFSRLRKKSEIL
jgi:hypothetical protein